MIKTLVYLIAALHWLILVSIPFQIYFGVVDPTFPLWAKVSLLSIMLRIYSSSILCPLTELELKLRVKAGMPTFSDFNYHYLRLIPSLILKISKLWGRRDLND